MATTYSPRIVTDGLLMYLDAGNPKSAQAIRNPPVRKPLVYWRMDDAANTDAVSQIGGLTLTDFSGSIGTAAGKLGTSRDFDGANTEYFTRADETTMRFTGDFTFTCWIYTPPAGSMGVIRGIVSKWLGGGVPTADNEFRIALLSDNTIAFSVYETDLIATSFGALSPETWYHIACRRQGSALTVAVNRVTNTGTETTAVGGTVPFRIGNGSLYNPWANWIGRIDEVGKWDVALTDAEIATLYNEGRGFDPTNWWLDVSGNNNTGKPFNDPTFSAANGGSLSFDGTNDYIDCGNFADNLGEMTISCWININSLGSPLYSVLLRKMIDYVVGSGWFFAIRNSPDEGKITLLTQNDGGSEYNQKNTVSSIPLNQWIYICATLSGGVNGTIKFYFNGNEEPVSGSPVGTVTNTSTSETVKIGKSDGSGDTTSFNGKMASTSIYNRCLSDSEIKQNFNATKGRFGL